MTENELCHKIANTLKQNIEDEFNTKVYRFGFTEKDDENFIKLKPLGSQTPENAQHLFWFLIPVDEEDNIISNNYYNLSREANTAFPFSPEHRRAMDRFSSTLRTDDDLVSFMYSKIVNKIYYRGSIKVETYKPDDNIVINGDKIADLRYRYFRFYLPKMI